MSEERYVSSNRGNEGAITPYWGEHVARYCFAMQFVEGRRVLDIACGSGYGMPLLSAKARFVVGVEIDMKTAAEAVSFTAGRAAAVVAADGHWLPFPDGCFDVVTSFETLEHLDRRDLFLAECSRVLSVPGLCIVSTPNADFTRPVNGKPRNPFHKHEYTPEELRRQLSPYFDVREQVGQSLAERFSIPPFEEGQKRLPFTLKTQSKLFCWKVMNKFPLPLREALSRALWRRHFYPQEEDYCFRPETLSTAPVQLAVCRSRE